MRRDYMRLAREQLTEEGARLRWRQPSAASARQIRELLTLLLLPLRLCALLQSHCRQEEVSRLSRL